MRANHSKQYQMSIFNELGTLPERTINWLTHSWAFVFRIFIYPLIDPAMFDCLYSNVDSRPANPPQVVASLLIIQSLFNKTDDQMHDWMMSGSIDIRFATNTLGMAVEKLPTSDKQLTRFRERNREYARNHGGSCPLDECLKSISYGMAAMMGLGLKNIRIDSTMVGANIARMSKEDILYTINRKMVHVLCGSRGEDFNKKLSELKLDHYLEPSDRNAALYHSRSSWEEKGQKLAAEADAILSLCQAEDLVTEDGELFTRILREKTIVEEDGRRRMATAEDKVMKPTDVQNPADPEATYREKNRKEFIGYVVNLVESVGQYGSLVLSWDLEQNIASDSVMSYVFLKEAGAIVDGIQSWQKSLGIREDCGMTECQQLLKSRMDMVSGAIRDARKAGIPLPRSINVGDASCECTTGDGEQMSLDDLLASFGMGQDPDPSAGGPASTGGASGHGAGADSAPEDRRQAPKTETVEVPIPEVAATTIHGGDVPEKTTWTVLGKPGPEGIMLPEFADLEDGVRREAIIKLVREKNPWHIDGSGDVNYAACDGAYSTDELISAAREAGFELCPTDLLGKDTNPVLGLYQLAPDRKTVITCPAGHVPVSQNSYKNGHIRFKMDAKYCRACPFRNDCRCNFLKTVEEASVTISPNAQGRIFAEANFGSEEYKNVGRFRNGIETIPSYLHNHLDIDHMPIGFAVKKACMGLKVAALNVRKFTLFAFGRSKIAENPILSRACMAT